MEQHVRQDAPLDEERSPAFPVRRFSEETSGYRWSDVSVLDYKPDGTHFKGITRQILFGEAEDLVCQLRYFEIEPGGHSTLEKHEHEHAVLILQGRGRVLVGDVVHEVTPFDLVYVSPMTWHQFRADDWDGLGFLCLVPCDRDHPVRPDAEAANALRTHPVIGDFIRL